MHITDGYIYGFVPVCQTGFGNFGASFFAVKKAQLKTVS